MEVVRARGWGNRSEVVESMRYATHDRPVLRRTWALASLLAGAAIASAAPISTAQGVPNYREYAARMHDRLVGVPPDAVILDTMEALVAVGRAEDAADIAMQNPAFYNSTLKTWIAPWTNEAMDVFVPFNDYIATVIGIIRDDRPFSEVLTGNYLYIGRGGQVDNGQGIVPAAYSPTDNLHYEQLEASGVDLSSSADFVPWPQDSLPGSMLDSSESAGIVTSRAAGEAFFSGGTNRAMWRFTAINFLCVDMEQLSDNTRSIDRIRQDVSRSPGGDSDIFLNQCSGCHSGMDPLSGAYAFFDWDEAQQRMVYTRGEVQLKNLINGSSFPFGYVTVDDRWDNYWREGQNAIFGWSDSLPGAGYGVRGMGEEIAASRGFARCQVQKVFKQLCFREPANELERNEVERIATDFEDFGYSMKTVFAKVAAYCMDD